MTILPISADCFLSRPANRHLASGLNAYVYTNQNRLNLLAMILITSPVRDKGVVFLKRKKEVWNWMPALELNIKLPLFMMTQSWMGTDFTNDDLVKESSVVED